MTRLLIFILLIMLISPFNCFAQDDIINDMNEDLYYSGDYNDPTYVFSRELFFHSIIICVFVYLLSYRFNLDKFDSQMVLGAVLCGCIISAFTFPIITDILWSKNEFINFLYYLFSIIISILIYVFVCRKKIDVYVNFSTVFAVMTGVVIQRNFSRFDLGKHFLIYISIAIIELITVVIFLVNLSALSANNTKESP